MIRAVTRWIENSRRWRYWMHKLANHDALQPIVALTNNRVEAGLRTLVRMGYGPQLVVDVGAHSGEWTKMALPCFPNAAFVMLEAQADREAALKQVQAAAPHRVSYVIGLLGRKEEPEVEFFLADTGSSLYPENTSFPRRRTSLPMTTLDRALADHASVSEALVKLDVQGAELEVLSGAENILARTNVVLMEVSLVEYNDRAPRVAEVVAEMRRRDFLLFDIFDLRHIGPILAQVDFLFVRRNSPLEAYARGVVGSYGRQSAVLAD